MKLFLTIIVINYFNLIQIDFADLFLSEGSCVFKNVFCDHFAVFNLNF